MGATESWFVVKKLVLHTENDGPVAMRKGSDPHETEMSIEDAVSHFSKEKVASSLLDVAKSVLAGHYDRKAQP